MLAIIVRQAREKIMGSAHKEAPSAAQMLAQLSHEIEHRDCVVETITWRLLFLGHRVPGLLRQGNS
jgi:hypothetical protein